MKNVKQLLLLSSLSIASFFANAGASQIQVSYDKYGQVELSSFNASVSKEEAWEQYKLVTSSNLFLENDLDNASDIVKQLALLDGKANFIFTRSSLPDSKSLTEGELQARMNEEGYNICVTAETRTDSLLQHCYAVAGLLTEEMSIEERNEVILSALESLKKKMKHLTL